MNLCSDVDEASESVVVRGASCSLQVDELHPIATVNLEGVIGRKIRLRQICGAEDKATGVYKLSNVDFRHLVTLSKEGWSHLNQEI